MRTTDGELLLRFHIPVRLRRGENNREHPQARARRVKAEHLAVFYATLGTRRAVLAALMPAPVVVTLTRVSPGPGLDSHDNLPGSLKAVVDQLADILGVNDRDPRVTWKYAPQERGEWGVWVHVTATLPGPEVVAPTAAAKKYARPLKKPKSRRAHPDPIASAERAGNAFMRRELGVAFANAKPAYVAPRRAP